MPDVIVASPLLRHFHSIVNLASREMSIMIIAPSYLEFAASFYPRLLEEVSSDDEFILKGLSFLSPTQCSELRDFLLSALNGTCTIEELQRAWMSAGPRFGFSDQDLIQFLSLTLRLLE